jgi:MYXO-CTERM domain-containing protein
VPIKAAGATTFDWTGSSASLVSTQHDVGILYLPTSITLSTYPAVEQTEQADGTPVVSVGRTNNGDSSTTGLYVSQPVTVSNGSEASPAFPYDYIAMDVIENDDSGGPTELPQTTPHMIVAVNSGESNGEEVLARTDAVYAWIAMEISQHATAPSTMAGGDGGTVVTIGGDGGARDAEADAKGSRGSLPNLSPSSGGCSAAPSAPPDGSALAVPAALALIARRRRRRGRAATR